MTNQGQLRIRVRASSLYSKDTNGYSLNNTPNTLDFPSPVFDYFTGQELSHPYKDRESVKSRINNWNQWFDRDNTSPMPLSPDTPPFAEQDIKTKDTKGLQEHNIDSVAMQEKVSHSKTSQEAPGGAVWV